MNEEKKGGSKKSRLRRQRGGKDIMKTDKHARITQITTAFRIEVDKHSKKKELVGIDDGYGVVTAT